MAEITARLPNFKGLVKYLFFTHNTLVSVLYTIITSFGPKHLRCCNEAGMAINKGLQFRHGLDSQYGDIIFVMKNDFWLSMKGTHSHTHEILPHAWIGHIFKDDLVEYHNENDKFIVERWLEKDARLFDFRRPFPVGSNINEHPGGHECRHREWNVSWCNLQVHLGENVNFSHVEKVYAPAWILYDNKTMARIRSNGLNVALLRALVSNQLPNFPNGEQEENHLNGKFHLYGPPIANNHYFSIRKNKERIVHDYIANHTYGTILPKSNNFTIATYRQSTHSTSTMYLHEEAFIDLEVKYMADLVACNMTYVESNQVAQLVKQELFSYPLLNMAQDREEQCLQNSKYRLS
jgi:hypothetical protein